MAPVTQQKTGMQKLVISVRKGCLGFYTAAFKPSLHSFFLWSTVIYLSCGIAVMITRPGVEALFCANEQAEAAVLREALIEPGINAATSQALQVDLGLACKTCPARLLLCPKDACFQAAVNITWQKEAKLPTGALFAEFSEASGEPECNEIYKMPSVNDPVKLVQQVAASAMLPAVKKPCLKFACGILETAMLNHDLNNVNDNCTNKLDTKFRQQDVCICKGLLQDPLMPSSLTSCGGDLEEARRKLCTIWNGAIGTDNPPTFWPAFCVSTTMTTSTMTVTTTTVTAAVRRLQDEEEAAEEDPAAADAGAAPAAASPSPAASAAAALPEYIVGPFSPCSCYQQCIPGVQTRTVTCEAKACKAPVPATKMGCLCSHCVKCMSAPFTLALMIGFFVQGGLAAFVFLCYLKTSTETEEDFVKMTLCKKCGGFFVKQVPPVVRLLVLAQLLQLILLVAQVFVAKWAGLTTMEECFHSEGLRTLTILCVAMWLIQVLMARLAKIFTRKPDWLHSPERSNAGFPIKQLKIILRNLGP